MPLKIASRAAGLKKSLIRQVFDAAEPGAINLGLGQPAIDPHPAILEALAQAARDKKAAYTPNAGDSQLRRRIAAELFDDAPMESVVVTIGAEEAMYCALTTLCEPGDEILGPEPGYPGYRTIATLLGTPYVPYALTPGNEFRIDVDALLAQVTGKTKVVIVTSPSNPLGRFAGTNTAMQRLMSELEARGVWVIDDCLYRDIAFVEHHAPLRKFGKNVLTIDAISKNFACTGLRVGWLQVPVEISPQVVAVHQALATTAPTPSQEAAKACLDLRKTDYLKEVRALYKQRADAAVAALAKEPKLKFSPPEGAFYIFADLREFGVDTVELAFSLARAGQVITVPGEAFGPGGGGFLRVTCAPAPEQVTEGIQRLLDGLRRYDNVVAFPRRAS